jgi:Undecaprenyl-phosphate glucose phosphotransferase
MDLAADLPLPDKPSTPETDAIRPFTTAAAQALRRGPMRPAALSSARRRLSGKVLARRFRHIDMTALGLLAVLSLARGHGDLLGTPLRSALPPALGAMLILVMLKAADVYAFALRENLWRHLGKVAGATLGGAVGAGAAGLLLGGDLAGVQRFILFCLPVLTGLHSVEWAKVRRWRADGLLTPNVVVVGATDNAGRLIQAALAARDAAILGVFDDRMSRIPEHIHGVPVLGDTKTLLTHKLLPYIDRIIITVTPAAQHRVRELIDRLQFLPNAVTLFMDVEGIEAQRSALSRLADAPLTQVSGARGNDAKADAKRLQDIIVCGLALVITAPVMLLIALAVRLDSPGPIFFRQRRYGFNNEMIEVWKFRSMRQDLTDATAARQISADDDRVTRVGRIIRRLSLDELPQLFNVMKGEMSLVGPRPHAIGMQTAGEDSARLVAEYAWRHRMKPGITGWAQINGSIGAVDTPDLVRRRVALDVEYIERQSFWFDLYILLATLPALIRARNAVR